MVSVQHPTTTLSWTRFCFFFFGGGASSRWMLPGGRVEEGPVEEETHSQQLVATEEDNAKSLGYTGGYPP